MPVYFFDVGDDGTWVRDDQGIALEHRDDMAREAVTVITDMLINDPGDPDGRSIECRVRDEDGQVVYRASIALHHSAGYRTLAVRPRIARLDGIWRDTVLLERRRDDEVEGASSSR